jgi:hypothetical protein
VAFRKSQEKSKKIIFDLGKDSIMSAMTSLMTTKECMDTLVNMYEKQAPSHKRTLKHKLKYLKMEKGKSVASFYSRIAHIRDWILVTGVTMDDDDLVHVIFDGLPSSWDTFLSSVSGREIQPTFERLWHDCLQEESRTATRSEPTKEEHSALASRFKGKNKVTFQKGSQRKPNTKGKFKGKNVDTSKIKCFSCNKLGHFAKVVGLEINIQGKGNIMHQLLRMMNPKEIRKFFLMRKKIEKNITWFFPYPVQFSRGRKLG